MTAFLLIHGSWHGAWCWDRLVPLLRDRGHTAVAVDLPAHGDDQTSLLRVTLGSYARRVRDAAAGFDAPPIVVGHSMGGLAITQAAADAPDAIGALVYLCAFAPVPGESLYGLARRDTASHVRPNARIRPSGIQLGPDPARIAFYSHCDPADADAALEKLRPDPWLPLIQRYTERHPITIPRGYIACSEDRAVSIEHQRFMAERTPMDRVSTLKSDHSPFLSQPDTLADHLDEMASLPSLRSPQ